MALRAIVAEVIGHVIGIGYPLKIRPVAGIAVIWRILIPVGVAGDTLQGNMRPR